MKALAFIAASAAISASAGVLETSMFRRVLSFEASGYDGASTLTNFPVLVRLSEADVAGFRYAELGDTTNAVYDALRFGDASGRSLDYEIDTWDTNGLSAVWVSLPVLSGRTTKFKAYWASANGSALPPVHPTNVWTSAGYVGVWHFAHRIGDVASTAYYPDSTGRGSNIMNPTGSTGWWLGNPTNDASCNANGTSWYPGGSRGNAVNTGDWAFSQTGYSVEIWTLNAHYEDKNTYVCASACETNSGAEVQWCPSNGIQLYRDRAILMGGAVKSEYSVRYAWTGDATNDWHYLSAVWAPADSGEKSILYEAASGLEEGEWRVLGRIGRTAIDFTGGDDRFRGGMGIIGAWDNGGGTIFRIDEPRIRRVRSTTDWIQANWDTQRNGTDFLTVGEVKNRDIGLKISLR